MKQKKTIIITLVVILCSNFAWSQILKDTAGIASFYADKFNGRKTANGEKFDNTKFTAAHRTLPFGTNLLVTNPKNGKQVTVRVNDRGPFTKNRLIDLSKAAAKELELISAGLGKVYIKVVDSMPEEIALPEMAVDTLQVASNLEDSISIPEKVVEVKQDTAKKWYYGIQVGTFKDSRNIEKLKTAVTEITNEPIFVFEYPKEDEVLYQIVIGNFEDRQKAIALRKKLQTYYKDAFVTHYQN